MDYLGIIEAIEATVGYVGIIEATVGFETSPGVRLDYVGIIEATPGSVHDVDQQRI